MRHGRSPNHDRSRCSYLRCRATFTDSLCSQTRSKLSRDSLCHVVCSFQGQHAPLVHVFRARCIETARGPSAMPNSALKQRHPPRHRGRSRGRGRGCAVQGQVPNTTRTNTSGCGTHTLLSTLPTHLCIIGVIRWWMSSRHLRCRSTCTTDRTSPRSLGVRTCSRSSRSSADSSNFRGRWGVTSKGKWGRVCAGCRIRGRRSGWVRHAMTAAAFRWHGLRLRLRL